MCNDHEILKELEVLCENEGVGSLSDDELIALIIRRGNSLKDISEVYVVKYKGRGQRICEGYCNTWDEFIEDVFIQIKENIDVMNYHKWFLIH